MRRIDADEIENFIVNGLNEKDPLKQFGHDAIEILAEIHCAPTIDAVQNGKWEWRGKDRGYFCTNCGSGCLLNYESDWHKSDFCPHCGADMRGGNDD